MAFGLSSDADMRENFAGKALLQFRQCSKAPDANSLAR
jgi:hypothetical protein